MDPTRGILHNTPALYESYETPSSCEFCRFTHKLIVAHSHTLSPCINTLTEALAQGLMHTGKAKCLPICISNNSFVAILIPRHPYHVVGPGALPCLPSGHQSPLQSGLKSDPQCFPTPLGLSRFSKVRIARILKNNQI